jgi:hypothetical protein
MRKTRKQRNNAIKQAQLWVCSLLGTILGLASGSSSQSNEIDSPDDLFFTVSDRSISSGRLKLKSSSIPIG